MKLLRRLRCWLGWCPGHVITGLHTNIVWIGWKCDRCGKVKDYQPARH